MQYIEEHFTGDHVTFVDNKGIGIEDLILDGPYIHHFVEIAGDYRKEIAEFCKYFPSLKVDKFV